MNGEKIALNYYVDLTDVSEDERLLDSAEHRVIRHLRKQHFNNLSVSELINCHNQTFKLKDFDVSINLDDLEPLFE